MKKLIVLFLLTTLPVFSQTTWFNLNSGTPTKLNSSFFIDNNIGYCVGDSGRILKTTNSGLNWLIQNTGNIGGALPKLLSIYFVNANTGFIVGGFYSGSSGLILKTTNSGVNWNSSVPFGSSMNSVFFTSANTGYVVGNSGRIYKSINSGNSWTSLLFNNNSLNSVYFNNNNTGYAVGISGVILKTINGGVNWNILNSNTNYSLTSVQFINDSIGYISAIGGKMLKTTNSGQNWTTISILGVSDNFNSLFFFNSNVGYLVGQGSTIVKTTDGGLNWDSELSPTNQTLNCIKFTDSNTGFAVGYNGSIIKTTNAGNSFSGIVINPKIAIEGMYFPLFNMMSRKDVINVYLRNASFPYAIKDSASGIIDSVSLSGIFYFNNTPSGNYYLVIKHFNSIETWSKMGGEILVNDGSSYSYDFTNLISKAYGNNLTYKGSKYCIYSGDINQDGIIDATDLSSVENDKTNSISGYVSTDVNGDYFVDASDLSIVDNNKDNGIIMISP